MTILLRYSLAIQLKFMTTFLSSEVCFRFNAFEVAFFIVYSISSRFRLKQKKLHLVIDFANILSTALELQSFDSQKIVHINSVL